MRRTGTCTQHLLPCMLKLTNRRHKVGYSLHNRSTKAASPLTLHQIPQRTTSIVAAEGVEIQPYRHCRNSVTAFSKTDRPIHRRKALGVDVTMPRCRPSAALPSASETAVLFVLFPLQHYLFSHTLSRTHTHALTHSVTTPTSVSPNPLLLLSLLLLSLSLRGSPPISPFSFHHLFIPLLSRSLWLSPPSQICDAAHKVPYAAVPPHHHHHHSHRYVCTTTLILMSWIHTGCLDSHT